MRARRSIREPRARGTTLLEEIELIAETELGGVVRLRPAQTIELSAHNTYYVTNATEGPEGSARQIAGFKLDVVSG